MSHPDTTPRRIKSFIFTALPCEAKPLIAHFKLKKDLTHHPFTLYYNDEMVLTVSGLGKIAMAAAVAYSLAKFPSIGHPVLVNVGIAGHKTANIGELFAAHKITDADTKRSFYPQLIAKLPCATQNLVTVSNPETIYTENALYDMESSGFYEIACRFTGSELIQAFKVVSDNQNTSIQHINAPVVNEWISAQVEKIAAGILALETLAHSLQTKESPYYQVALENWHFTVNAQLQLKALLQRWDALTDGENLDFSESNLKNSKAVLQWLEQKINNLEFKL